MKLTPLGDRVVLKQSVAEETTKKKTNVYIDRYTPVEGAVGDLNTIYKLEISMVSNVIQPYDVLNNYTGILYK